ncbi:MAG: triphosphoribosyl-dephospho-CoA synthase, partial [Firmicutes bacterium]|nr:triphosphoribosyl-dephospho-CoA synthase [Bacillota bacterium]
MRLKAVTVEDMMTVRERRAGGQAALLKEMARAGAFCAAGEDPGSDCCVVTFTMNVPGPYKVFPGISYAFESGLKRLRVILRDEGISILKEARTCGAGGFEAALGVRADAVRLKELCVRADSERPLGRLFDIDVSVPGPGGLPVKIERTEAGFGPRRCLVCPRKAFECARSRRHSVFELIMEAKHLIFSDLMGRACRGALMDELFLTPKPGLVDMADSGAHSDMNDAMLRESIDAIAPFILEMAEAGFELGKAEAFKNKGFKGIPGRGPGAANGEDGLSDGSHSDGLFGCARTLRMLGVMAERAMMNSTGGVNSHRGAIYSMGILAAALGREYAAMDLSAPESGEDPEISCEDFFEKVRGSAARIAGAVERMKSEAGPGSSEGETGEQCGSAPGASLSHGAVVKEKYGAEGARGEALRGFPSAFTALDEFEETGSWKLALLRLMAETGDTTVLYRTGREGLSYMQTKAAKALEELKRHDAAHPDCPKAPGGGDPGDEVLSAMNRDFISRNISPGGCADMLSCAMLLEA